jgi:two-component system NtrC family sensor kinase
MQRRLERVGLLRNLPLIAAIAIFYGVAGLLGVKLAVLPGEVTAVWIPAGIGLGAILLWGQSVWPGIWLGSFGISVVIDPTPISLSIGAFTAIGNTLTPLLGAFLIRRFSRTSYPFRRASEVFQFVAWGAIASQSISATIGTTVLCVGQWVDWSNFGPSWLTWWVSNATGVLIVTPLLLTWHHSIQKLLEHPVSYFWDWWREIRQFPWERLSWFFLFDLVVILAFWHAHPVEYLTIPLLVWAAFRFSEQWTTLAIAVSAAMAIAGTIAGNSSFVRDNLNASLLFLESFIGVISVTTLVLIAVLKERRRAVEGLKKAKLELESRVLERTRELSQANEQLQRQELHLRDKADSLAQALRQLKQTQAQLIQNEKMTSLGQLVAGMAHEINNPVSFIYSNLSPAKDYFRDFLLLLSLYQEKYPEPDPDIVELSTEIDLNFLKEDCFKLLDSMQAGADRIHRIVLSLRNFSRLDEAQLKWVDLHDGIESALLILQHRITGLPTDCHRSPIEVIKNYSELPNVECFAGEINQVFMNLLTNAIDAIDSLLPTSPQICIQTNLCDRDRVIISITDNGGGIAPEIQDHIFDPFFTTKPVGKGTGLGLYTSYETIANKHRGDLRVSSQLGVGTTIEIVLPIRYDV